MPITLNNTKEIELLQYDYFIRMMLPMAEKFADPYVFEEQKALVSLLKKIPNLQNYNFTVIGSGALWYIDLVYNFVNKYIAVEPHANIFISKQLKFILNKHPNISIIDQYFGDFPPTVFEGNKTIFTFHFNILAYIPDPIKVINQYIKPGDILYISTWGTNSRAIQARNDYFNYINKGVLDSTNKIDPKSNIGLCNFDVFPYDLLKHYQSHERYKGDITDILIINI
jgi:hypothetical protein